MSQPELFSLLMLFKEEFLSFDSLPLSDNFKLLDLSQFVLHLLLLLVVKPFLPLVLLNLYVHCSISFLFNLQALKVECASVKVIL